MPLNILNTNIYLASCHLSLLILILASNSLQTALTVTPVTVTGDLALGDWERGVLRGENLLFLRMGLEEMKRLLGTDLGVPCGELSAESYDVFILSLIGSEGDLESSSSFSRW